MGGPIRDFRDFIVWQKAIQFAKEVYQVTRDFPGDERFGLTNQVRRAAVSVSSNVAEGYARQGREFAHYASVARGSLAECESQLHLVAELGMASPATTAPALSLAVEIRKMLAALSAKLRDRPQPPT